MHQIVGKVKLKTVNLKGKEEEEIAEHCIWISLPHLNIVCCSLCQKFITVLRENKRTIKMLLCFRFHFNLVSDSDLPVRDRPCL